MEGKAAEMSGRLKEGKRKLRRVDGGDFQSVTWVQTHPVGFAYEETLYTPTFQLMTC